MIQADLWLDRLSVASLMEQAQNLELWHALRLQLELRLSVDVAVDMSSCGIWSLELQEEYIAQVNSERYLVPPQLRLRIDDTCPKGVDLIELSHLVYALELATDIQPDKIYTWLQTIDTLLNEQLSVGREVNWSGIGIWSHSVDGRYQLSLARSFIDALNRPLSVFTPIRLINESCSVGLRCIHFTNAEDIQNFSEPLYIRREENSCTAPIQETEDDSIVTQEIQQDTPSLPAIERQGIEKPTTINTRPYARWFGYGALALIMLIALGLYLFEFYREPQTNFVKPLRVAISTNPEIKASSAIIDSSHMRQPAPVISSPKDSLPTITIDETEVIVMQEGEGLMRIAERKYGHKVFWVYIYEENKDVLNDPNNVPIGVRLRLPLAHKYGIDPHNTKSLERALIIQRSLFRK